MPQSSTMRKKNIPAPIANKMPHKMQIHNHQRIDNYYWMRDDERKDKTILAHLEAENHYADEMLAEQKPLQTLLFNELKNSDVFNICHAA